MLRAGSTSNDSENLEPTRGRYGARHLNDGIGCSSIWVGANPSWLWKKSKNATPTISALE
jgi:hypothetical protein